MSESAEKLSLLKIEKGIGEMLNPATLLAALETEDEIGRMLRIHLQLERMVDVFLYWSITDEVRKEIEIPKFFAGKLALAAVLGLPLQIVRAVKELNKLRNKIAHVLGNSLDARDVAKLAELVDDVRKVLPIKVEPLGKCSIEVMKRGSGKIKFGEGGVEWDFTISAGMLVAWFSRYLGRMAYERFPENPS